jgi:hypothetical protein
MHPDSIYVLDIKNFLGFQKLKEDGRFMQFKKLSEKEAKP